MGHSQLHESGIPFKSSLRQRGQAVISESSEKGKHGEYVMNNQRYKIAARYFSNIVQLDCERQAPC